MDTIYYSPTGTKQSVPYTGTSPNLFNVTTVNPSARTTTLTAPDGTSTTTLVNGLLTTVTDGRGNSTTSTSDLWGRVVTVTPPTGPLVTYTYDELDRLLTATRGGAATSIKYDNAGRKINMDDPDMGMAGTPNDGSWAWSYGYDALGNLTSQTDARGCTLTLAYDSLNRLSSKSSSGAGCGTQVSAAYTYDVGTNGKGLRTSMTDGSGSTAWTYDMRGRVLTESKTITGAGTFNTSWAYNAADLLASMTYPGDGETVFYGYNSRMLLNSLSGTNTYVSSTVYDAAGRVTSRTMGNNLTQNFTYYPWNKTESVDGVQTGQGGRLKNITVGTLQNMNYLYDAVGNIRQITNTPASETNTYSYDALDRLTSWSLNGGTPETYSYDTGSGNQTSKAGLSFAYNAQVTCAAGTRTIPHAVSSASPYTYAYDCNGNQTTQVGNGQTLNFGYDAENRLVSVSGATTASFVYDGDGKRVKATVNSITTTFIGSYYELTGSTVTKYYLAGTQRVAMRKYTVPQSMALEYLLGDHLGSTSITTNTAGAKVSEIRYKPWGEIRYSWTSPDVSGTTPSYKLSSYTFTGQYSYMDDPTTTGVTEGFGLMFYNARFYSPYINQFTSADTIIPNPADPQSLNRYSYVNNNPLRYTDPTGHMRVDDEFGGGDVYTPPISNNNNNNHNDDDDDNTQQSPPPNTESGQSTSSSFPSPNAWVISFSYSAGFLAWYRLWSIDIVITNDEIGFFRVDAIGPGFGRLEVPSTIPQRRMDTSFAFPSVGGTVFGGCVWGNSLEVISKMVS